MPVDPTDTAAALSLSALTVTMVISLFIPIVNGIITKATLSSWVKGLLTLILNAVSAAVVTATVADGTAVFSEQTLIATLLGLAISVATYVGVYKPAGLTSSDNGGKLGPTHGLG